MFAEACWVRAEHWRTGPKRHKAPLGSIAQETAVRDDKDDREWDYHCQCSRGQMNDCCCRAYQSNFSPRLWCSALTVCLVVLQWFKIWEGGSREDELEREDPPPYRLGAQMTGKAQRESLIAQFLLSLSLFLFLCLYHHLSFSLYFLATKLWAALFIHALTIMINCNCRDHELR